MTAKPDAARRYSAANKNDGKNLTEYIMISCTEFIPAYSELFKYLEKKDGKKAVIDFWEYISDNYLLELRSLAQSHGIRGCFIYWSKALNEEAADFTMTLDEESGEFRIDMHLCPSKGRLNNLKHIEPYRDYCEHCQILYERVLASIGLEYSIDLSQCDQAKCSITVKQTLGNK